jgi:hypothetical protein
MSSSQIATGSWLNNVNQSKVFHVKSQQISNSIPTPAYHMLFSVFMHAWTCAAAVISGWDWTFTMFEFSEMKYRTTHACQTTLRHAIGDSFLIPKYIVASVCSAEYVTLLTSTFCGFLVWMGATRLHNSQGQRRSMRMARKCRNT